MSDAIEKLKSLGSQQIYMDTHIPTSYVEAILDEEYEKLTRTQFFGFVSIFERDYNIDLEELKAHATEYYDTEMGKQPLADTTVFVAEPEQKNFTVVYIVVVVSIFLLALYYTLGVTDKSNKTSAIQTKISSKQSVEKKVIVPVEKTPIVLEVNSSTKEQNLTKPIEKPVVKKIAEKSGVLQPLEILPRSRVWLGYINVATNKKRQKTFSNELDLNASKEWLFIFGHGYVDVIVNGKTIHFNDRHTLRLHYKDGVLDKISTDEFKKLNRGHKW